MDGLPMAQTPDAPARPSSASPPASAVPLTDLPKGAVAELRRVDDSHSRAVLRSLGLTDGAKLRLCRLGDPFIIQVRATRIGLSKSVAQSVFVSLAEGPAR
jgi:Fe2+ transport system protein FeoA